MVSARGGGRRGRQAGQGAQAPSPCCAGRLPLPPLPSTLYACRWFAPPSPSPLSSPPPVWCSTSRAGRLLLCVSLLVQRPPLPPLGAGLHVPAHLLTHHRHHLNALLVLPCPPLCCSIIRESAWQLELKGDVTRQRRLEAVDKLMSVLTLVVAAVFGVQALGLDVNSGKQGGGGGLSLVSVRLVRGERARGKRAKGLPGGGKQVVHVSCAAHTRF